MAIRILIADDHQIILDGFIAIFNSVDQIDLVGTVRNGKEVLEFIEHNPIDVALLDINMPVLSGVEACKKIKKKYPNIKVIALSMFDQVSYFRRIMQHGADGYLLKDDSFEEIELAIEQVMKGEKYISKQLQSRLSSLDVLIGTNKQNLAQVSEREKEVLDLLGDGLTDMQIGQRLFISHHTVKSHRKKLLAKLDAKNTTELVKKALERGLI